MPFTTAVPDGKTAKVYYIATNGDRTDMNAVFENGTVTFDTNHFSSYAVIFEDSSSPSGGGFPIWIVVVIVVVIAAVGVGAFFFIKQKKA